MENQYKYSTLFEKAEDADEQMPQIRSVPIFCSRSALASF